MPKQFITVTGYQKPSGQFWIWDQKTQSFVPEPSTSTYEEGLYLSKCCAGNWTREARKYSGPNGPSSPSDIVLKTIRIRISPTQGKEKQKDDRMETLRAEGEARLAALRAEAEQRGKEPIRISPKFLTNKK